MKNKNYDSKKYNITDTKMETGLQLGSKLLQVGSKMRDLTWSNSYPCYKPSSIFETVIVSPTFYHPISTQNKCQ